MTKAYQVKIEIENSKPLIWRRVVMPMNATFNRLHDVIQNVFNFKDAHLFKFDLLDYNISVTNDDEAYLVYQEFKKSQKAMEAALGALNTPFAQRQLENLRTVIRRPTGIKIDQYLQEQGKLDYTYDFSDNWEILVTLEKIVEDYRFGYPTSLSGEETAPPEDVGGLPGFYEFLEAYRDPKSPDHSHAQLWAKEQGFREYDSDHINLRLKLIKYK